MTNSYFSEMPEEVNQIIYKNVFKNVLNKIEKIGSVILCVVGTISVIDTFLYQSLRKQHQRHYHI